MPIEPRSALAEWQDDSLTVWTGSQRPFGVRQELAQHFNLPEEKIRVIVPDTGSGYGGKHNGEAAIEAARLAKALGKPVKRDWTREEEMTWAYFRPGGLIEAGGKLNPDGTLYRENLRNADSTDLYVLRGAGVEVYRPHFTFHGFRYVELTGFPGTPTDDSVSGEVVSSLSGEPTATITTTTG